MDKLLTILISFIIISLTPLNAYAVNNVYRLENTAPLKIAAAIDVSGNETIGGKSPLIAMGLSFFIPGAGQVYNGETIKGIGLFAGIVSLVVLSLLVIEPAKAEATKLKKTNSLLDIIALVTRVGTPVLWVYNWGSAYQSADPVYLRKQREEELKKEKQNNTENSISNNFEIKLLSCNF
jgi:TM2 domain-containing membrane protein YozV